MAKEAKELMLNPNAPARPAVRYHGAKWLLAPWIISQLPPHDVYVEPFAGSGAVLLRKSRSLIEVYNDLDGELVNFFRILRDDPELLIRAIKFTPYAIEEWEQSFEPTEDHVEAARRFYIRGYMSIAGATAQWNTGFRRQIVYSRGADGRKKMTPAAVSFSRIEHLYQVADRLRGVVIERDDALVIIERYDQPETCFYIDPPYVTETRGRWKEKAYSHEMNDDDHRELAKLLHQIEGGALISGYRCDLYDGLYSDWHRLDKSARVNGPGSAIESLWISPRAVRRKRHGDLPLFSSINGNSHMQD